MLKANIEIDNNTASGLSPIEWISKHILNDSVLLKYNKKTKTATYKNGHATITLKNLRQI